MIYLVGDVVDHFGHHIWPQQHADVIKLFVEKAESGQQIIYIPGNHDSFFRNHYGDYGKLKILPNIKHKTLHGKTYFVTHGDETDRLKLSTALNFITAFERNTKFHLWDIARRNLSILVKKHTEAFERKMAARYAAFDGVICGHVHAPNITNNYLNCGDWTIHCTAIVETQTGNFELLHAQDGKNTELAAAQGLEKLV